jgi:hypothetical protein
MIEIILALVIFNLGLGLANYKCIRRLESLLSVLKKKD